MGNNQHDIIPIERSHIQTSPPDPGENGARFIAWLKKRSGIRKLLLCIRRWNSEDFDVRAFVRQMGNDKLIIARSNNGDRYVKVIDDDWADQWLMHYDVAIPHHGQWRRI